MIGRPASTPPCGRERLWLIRLKRFARSSGMVAAPPLEDLSGTHRSRLIGYKHCRSAAGVRCKRGMHAVVTRLRGRRELDCAAPSEYGSRAPVVPSRPMLRWPGYWWVMSTSPTLMSPNLVFPVSSAGSGVKLVVPSETVPDAVACRKVPFKWKFTQTPGGSSWR